MYNRWVHNNILYACTIAFGRSNELNNVTVYIKRWRFRQCVIRTSRIYKCIQICLYVHTTVNCSIPIPLLYYAIALFVGTYIDDVYRLTFIFGYSGVTVRSFFNTLTIFKWLYILLSCNKRVDKVCDATTQLNSEPLKNEQFNIQRTPRNFVSDQ